MIDSFDSRWWDEGRSQKDGKKRDHEISDSDLFQMELSKIEEALEKIAQLIKKYTEE